MLADQSAERDLRRILAGGTVDASGKVIDKIIGRQLDVQPTITVRPGWTFRILLTRNLLLEPYTDSRTGGRVGVAATSFLQPFHTRNPMSLTSTTNRLNGEATTTNATANGETARPLPKLCAFHREPPKTFQLRMEADDFERLEHYTRFYNEALSAEVTSGDVAAHIVGQFIDRDRSFRRWAERQD